MDRTLLVGNGASLKASASPRALLAGASLEAGYNIVSGPAMGNLTLTPFAGLDWLHMGFKGYSESGQGSFPLSVDKRSEQMMLGQVGLRASWQVALGDKFTLVPSLKAAYVHDFRSNPTRITGRFTSIQDTRFTIAGRGQDKNWTDLTAGLQLVSSDGYAIGLSYRTVLGARGAKSNQFGLGISLKW